MFTLGEYMFTGLIEHLGLVLANESRQEANRLSISAEFPTLEPGESIAVNGVCLTQLPHDSILHELHFDVSPETLNITTLGQLKKGDKVNLERAMLANARFGGHYVSGHIDTTATVLAKTKRDEFLEMTIGHFGKKDAHLYLLPKGSISIDGVSLTINTVSDAEIRIMLVPHTLANTTLEERKVGDRVNIEFDYFTRIVAHQLAISGLLKAEG